MLSVNIDIHKWWKIMLLKNVDPNLNKNVKNNEAEP